jgi:Reverse transcriptase (RNA-dependent DNA polymerase)
VNALANSTVFSAVDIKGAFNNIPLHPNSRQYTAFVTQDGLYEFNRMTFGFKTAPAHFQKSIMITLSVLPNGSVIAYIDDIVIHGNSIDEVWQHTLVALRALTWAGFMLNMRKCCFLTSKIKIVG